MPISYETIDQIYAILKRRLPLDLRKQLIDDLLQIEGNQSFRQSIKRLAILDNHDEE